MANYCTLKDIHKRLQAYNTALPNDLYRARESAENHIRISLSGKFNTSLFDSTIVELKILTIELSVYFLEVQKMSQQGNTAQQILEDETVNSRLTLANKQLKMLADRGDLFKSVTATGASFDSNNYYRFTGRPRNILVKNDALTSTYYVDEHYTIDYKAQTMIRVNSEMPSTGLTIAYQIPVRAQGM